MASSIRVIGRDRRKNAEGRSVHAWHAHVRHDDIKVPACKMQQRVVAAQREVHLPTVLQVSQPVLQAIENGLFVVNEQYSLLGCGVSVCHDDGDGFKAYAALVPAKFSPKPADCIYRLPFALTRPHLAH